MLRLFANANYDFIGFRQLGLRRHGRCSSCPGSSCCWSTGSTTASSSPAARWCRSRARQPVDVGALRAGLDRAGHPRRRDPELRRRPTSSSSAPGWPSRAPTPTTPRPPPTRCAQALDARARRRATTRSQRTEAVGPKVGGELRQQGVPRHLPLVLRGAGLPGLPVRVALRPRGRASPPRTTSSPRSRSSGCCASR